MRPVVRRMFVFALGGALAATAWVWSLWAMIGTLPTEHGPAADVSVAPAPALTPEPPAPPPVKKMPPPFRVKWVPPRGEGPVEEGRGGEFGYR